MAWTEPPLSLSLHLSLLFQDLLANVTRNSLSPFPLLLPHLIFDFCVAFPLFYFHLFLDT